jgi:hypothetical protein
MRRPRAAQQGSRRCRRPRARVQTCSSMLAPWTPEPPVAFQRMHGRHPVAEGRLLVVPRSTPRRRAWKNDHCETSQICTSPISTLGTWSRPGFLACNQPHGARPTCSILRHRRHPGDEAFGSTPFPSPDCTARKMRCGTTRTRPSPRDQMACPRRTSWAPARLESSTWLREHSCASTRLDGSRDARRDQSRVHHGTVYCLRTRRGRVPFYARPNTAQQPVVV